MRYVEEHSNPNQMIVIIISTFLSAIKCSFVTSVNYINQNNYEQHFCPKRKLAFTNGFRTETSKLSKSLKMYVWPTNREFDFIFLSCLL